jgi:outer membrane lipoprotein-sorting protein
MPEMNDRAALERIAERAVPDHLDLWPAIRARIEAGRATRAAPRAAGMFGRHRRLWLGVAAAVVLALVVGAASPLWSHPNRADAQTILSQAQASADGPVAVHTYHLLMTEQAGAKGNATITTEIWYAGSQRQRHDVQITGAAGALLASTQDVFNGAEVWLASTDAGQTQVVHTVGTSWNAMDDDPARQRSLTDVLARYGNDKTCMDPQLQGEATVAGQTAYVIVLTPKSGSGAADCVSDARPGSVPVASKARQAEEAAAKASKQAGQKPDLEGTVLADRPPEPARITVWVDKLSLLPLRTEVRDASGNLLDRSEVTSVEYNVAIPATVFVYTVPAGAGVTNFTGGTGADVKAALCDPPAEGKCPPSPAAKPWAGRAVPRP